MQQDNRKQNPEEFYTEYQKQIAWSYGYKLICVDDKFSNPSKSPWVKMQFTILLIIWSKKYCGEVMKKNFNKELVITKEDNEDFKNSTKCRISDNDCVDNDV